MSDPIWSTPLQFERVAVMGGGSGIGRATALELARAGVNVYVVGRRAKALEETRKLGDGLPGRIVALPCDLLNPDATDAAFTAMEEDGGPVRALVHAAAAPTIQIASEIDHKSFAATINTTLFLGFNAIKRWSKPLVAADYTGQEPLPASAVIITSAVCSRGGPGVAHSSAGKAGLESFARACAREWGQYGIRINIVGPGVFPVEKSVELWSDPEVRAHATGMTVFNRLGEVPEIVAPIMFFLTSGAGFTTGQTIIADGGAGLVPWGFNPDALKRGLNNQFEVVEQH